MVTIARLDPEGTLLKVIIFLTILLLTAAMVCLSYFDIWNISIAWSVAFGVIFLGLITFFLSIDLLFLASAVLSLLFCIASLIILV